jgi:enterochelin esterase-like enzyme
MNSARTAVLRSTIGLSFLLLAGTVAPGQTTKNAPRFGGPRVVSPDVQPDRKVTFRILAPKAQEVTVRGGWAGGGEGTALTKGEGDVWSVTVGPLEPNLYEYSFSVDGLKVVDPRNPIVKRGEGGLDASMLIVQGDQADFLALKDVPHGQVRTVWYNSPTTNGTRRMHVYTPPGYETSDAKYPVLYLFHGGGDDDEAWTTVGRANTILDNLIASGKAKPLIVVMPALLPFRGFGPNAGDAPDPFRDEMIKVIVPFVEKTFRAKTDRANRAMAGLSMGGAATLSVGLTNLDQFNDLGVFSAGFFGPQGAGMIESAKAKLADSKVRDGLHLFYVAIGKDDFLKRNSSEMVVALKGIGIPVNARETAGGHEWNNWRHYLAEFVPMLFDAEVPKPEESPTKPEDAAKATDAIPAAPSGFDKRRDGIEHGKMEVVEYESKTVGTTRKATVYTPPGYSKDQKYPVLYLLHGIGGDEREWPRGGSAEVVLDNMLADKVMVPMIVVMPNGRAAKDDKPGGDFRSQFPAFEAFERDLIDDLIPFVDSHYSTLADRDHRALAGLSMGGGQSLNFGLAHPETFAYVGGFSSAPNTKSNDVLLADHAEKAKKLTLLWVSCGDDDGLMNISERLHKALDEEKVPHIFHIDKGGHTFPVWKNDLYLFGSRIFREDQPAK